MADDDEHVACIGQSKQDDSLMSSSLWQIKPLPRWSVWYEMYWSEEHPLYQKSGVLFAVTWWRFRFQSRGLIWVPLRVGLLWTRKSREST